MTCRTCATSLAPDAAFCGSCGAPVRSRRDSRTGLLLDGRFRLDAKLAAGGFGAIYRATRVDTGAVLALKVLHADLATDGSLAARFRREAAVLARLRDPHTITTYELGEAPDGTLFIAMELLHGTSLLERFRAQGPVPWRRLVAILRGVCSSLAEAHALGIVHRDLKPANIHLEHRGDDAEFVKVLDFGVARVIDGSDIDDGSDLTRVGQAVGTLEYMAPEQIVGGACDGRSDIYTLGVVAYEMLTGRRPFADATGPTSLMTALLTRAPVPLAALVTDDGLPPELDGVIARCLERDPKHRYASVEELAAALDALLVQYPPPTSRPATTLPGVTAPPVAGRGAVVPLAPAAPVGTAPRRVSSDEATALDVTALTGRDPAWDATLPSARPLPARTPHLAHPPTYAHVEELADGSTVGPPPIHHPDAVAEPSVRRLVLWMVGLIAAGVGLGVAAASLA